MADEEPTNEQQPDASAGDAAEQAPDPTGAGDAQASEGADSAPTADDAAGMSAAEQLAGEAIDAAQQAAASIEQDAAAGASNGARFGPGGSSAPAPFTPEQLTQLAAIEGGEGINILADVDLNVKIELGRTRMLVEDVLRLSDGAVVELDKLAGDPVDIYVNERHVARGEVLILNDNFCVRVSEILEATIEER